METKTNEQQQTQDYVLKPENMKPGVKYRGYGMLSPYKEFTFTPERTGSQAGRETLLYEQGGFQIKKTKNRLIIRCSYPLQENKMEYLKEFSNSFNQFTLFIKTHEV